MADNKEPCLGPKNRQVTVTISKDGVVVTFDPNTGRRGPAINRIEICQWGQICFVHTNDSDFVVPEEQSGNLKKTGSKETPFGPMDVFQVLAQYSFWTKVINVGNEMWIDTWVERC
jgi:hypothetical protein